MEAWQSKFLDKIGQPSFNSFYKNSNSCSIRLEMDKIKVWPVKFSTPGKPSDGLVPVENELFEVKYEKASEKIFTAKIIEILQKDRMSW